MKKKKTKVDEATEFIVRIKKEFCQRLGFSEEEYCEIEFENAFKYLKIYNHPDSFTYSSTFWNWWKLSNAKMNEDLLLSGDLNILDIGKLRLHGSTYIQIKNESLNRTTQKAV